MRVSPDVRDRLEAEAKARGVTISAVCEQATINELELGVARLRLCPTCGSVQCDHAAPPPIGRLLEDGAPVMRDGVDLRAYTRAVWQMGAQLGGRR